jgi:hypothetical protein
MRRKLVTRGILLVLTGVSLYLLAPSLIETFSSWRSLAEISPLWLGDHGRVRSRELRRALGAATHRDRDVELVRDRNIAAARTPSAGSCLEEPQPPAPCNTDC